jgi:hypothetical protein
VFIFPLSWILAAFYMMLTISALRDISRDKCVTRLTWCKVLGGGVFLAVHVWLVVPTFIMLYSRTGLSGQVTVNFVVWAAAGAMPVWVFGLLRTVWYARKYRNPSTGAQ